jgi:hypothetical protein
MKAISLWQPWATFVTLKWKTIETRDHAGFFSLVGQRIAIHAAKRFDKTAALSLVKYRQLSPMEVINLCTYIKLNRGKILCTAVVRTAGWSTSFKHPREELEKQAMCDIEGKYLLFLEGIRPVYPEPVFRGCQGIFNVPDELVNK